MVATGIGLCLLLTVAGWSRVAAAAGATPENCIRIELFIRTGAERSTAALKYLQALERSWPGLSLEISDVTKDAQALRRARQLLKAHDISKPGLPIIHACGQLQVGFGDAKTTGKQIERWLTVEVFVREGCANCARGRTFLNRIRQRYPGFRIVYRDIIRERGARDELQALIRRHRVTAASTPVFHLCGCLIVGYLEDRTTGRQIERLMQQSCVRCVSETGLRQDDMKLVMVAVDLPDAGGTPGEDADEHAGHGRIEPPDAQLLDEFPLDDFPADSELPAIPPPPQEQQQQKVARAVDLPIVGRVSVQRIGLPLFTLAVGLVDGFNPCAMWVLLFLLSILVNMKDRWRILAVAGTFVVVSGVAYFAFMAAWLNVFMLVGYLRPSQVVLGLLAVFVGVVHVKDFFAAGRGFSLSIPESAKPGIYSRVRRIVTAEHLAGAVAGALVLAVLVNVIELLCTAGLPALYTQILSQQDLRPWQFYGYLGLYNVAYMFDDSLMVGIVVITLGRHKLQERQGRWLKLISGAVILLLGLLLLFQPEWLL